MAKKSKGDDQPTTITPAGSDDVRINSHPRAQMQIRRWKAMGGLAGFWAMVYLSHRSGTDFVHLSLRALLGGLVTYVAVWAASVYVWRQIAVAEIRRQATILAERKFAALDAAKQQNS